jgi:sec-independent protein translocase protein TatA
MESILPGFIGIPGGPELLVILGIAILLFGADKLPKLARSSGQAMGEFQKGRAELERELRESASEAPDSSDEDRHRDDDAVEAA